MNTRRAITLASLVWLGLSTQNAYSADWDSVLRSVFSAGRPSEVAQNQDLIKGNINTRQGQLEREIEDGVASGQLTAAEATELNLQLNKVAALEGTYLADRQLTNSEVQSLVDELAGVTQRLSSYLTNSSNEAGNTPHYTGHGGWGSYWRKYSGQGRPDDYARNQSVIQANINTKQAEIDAAIEQGIRQGTLSWDEAQQVRTRLNQIAATEYRYLADGRLSYSERDELLQKLDEAANKLEELKANHKWAYDRGRGNAWGHYRRNQSIDSRQSMLHQRIQRGISAGLINQQEAEKLYRKEAKINELEAKLRVSGNRLNYEEQKTLLAQLDTLKRDIDRQLRDRD